MVTNCKIDWYEQFQVSLHQDIISFKKMHLKCSRYQSSLDFNVLFMSEPFTNIHNGIFIWLMNQCPLLQKEELSSLSRVTARYCGYDLSAAEITEAEHTSNKRVDPDLSLDCLALTIVLQQDNKHRNALCDVCSAVCHADTYLTRYRVYVTHADGR